MGEPYVFCSFSKLIMLASFFPCVTQQAQSLVHTPVPRFFFFVCLEASARSFAHTRALFFVWHEASAVPVAHTPAPRSPGS